MASIAVNILSSFTISSDLTCRREFVNCIPALMKTLLSSRAIETRMEILKILFKLSEGFEGLEVILDKYNFDCILQLYELSEDEENASIQALGLKLINFCIAQWTEFVYYQKVANDIQLKNTLLETLPLVLQTLSEKYQKRHDKTKFEILDALIQLLEVAPQEFTRSISRSTTSFRTWTSSISLATKDVLSHKHASKSKENGLKLIALMLRHFGWDWLFCEFQDDHIKRQEKEKFAALVVELACIEINVRLDELSQESVTLKDLEGEEHGAVIDSYEILEKVISFLSSYIQNEEENDTQHIPIFSNESILKLHTSLKSTFSTILEFVLLKQADFPSSKFLENTFLLATIRVYASWLAEDDSLHKDTAEMLGLLIDVARLSDSSKEIVPLLFLCPAFLYMTESPEINEKFVSLGGPRMVVENLIHTFDEQKNSMSKNHLANLLYPYVQLLYNIESPNSFPFYSDTEKETFSRIMEFTKEKFGDGAFH
ncbi:hypothetical protein K493DRAFT_319834 [Basidiobolus meristosporus CBS 931.73]|uniref:Neurochondrin-domain-containing protein n=1 Tax=Basidiobolus meristosporus CBS 931.73 TaxID=1314790 RepID=A0A1Y1XKB0_9FUNG|nr:hypothetical protein K493DRAFT_319834 [Basidiobolus meristosporus CBS 931.73]|eukprot:ORX86152.1 hypothetical protein K493DRAFT_319834 [Basidiobolus meristosporus CBS 931.73]